MRPIRRTRRGTSSSWSGQHDVEDGCSSSSVNGWARRWRTTPSSRCGLAPRSAARRRDRLGDGEPGSAAVLVNPVAKCAPASQCRAIPGASRARPGPRACGRCTAGAASCVRQGSTSSSTIATRFTSSSPPQARQATGGGRARSSSSAARRAIGSLPGPRSTMPAPRAAEGAAAGRCEGRLRWSCSRIRRAPPAPEHRRHRGSTAFVVSVRRQHDAVEALCPSRLGAHGRERGAPDHLDHRVAIRTLPRAVGVEGAFRRTASSHQSRSATPVRCRTR